MRIGHSYKQVDLTGPFDVIVVGSGIGGLVCAGLLARHAGKRVLVLERHYTAGGFTHSFSRPGFDWDVGVHYIGQMLDPASSLRRLFDHLSDGQLAWADMGEVYDAIYIGADRYDFVRGREAFRARMHGYFPHERRSIDDYLTATRSIGRFTEAYFADRSMPRALASLAGPLLRFPLARYARQTTAEVMASFTRDPRLLAVLTGNFGDYGLPPSQSSFLMQALLSEHYMEGAAYPVGGASRIAATIIPGIEAAGGAVITSAPVREIVLERGRAVGVRLENGHELRAATVVSDAGAAITFHKLLPESARKAAGFDATLRELGSSVGSLTLYLGFEGTPEELSLPGHNLWIYPNERHDQNVARYMTSAAPKDDVPLPVAYCSFAAARDPDFQNRHPGHSTAEVITAADYAWFSRFGDAPWQKRGEEYEVLKQSFTARLLAPLLARLPQLKDRIRHCELSTPVSTQHFASHPRGEIYGLAHTPARFTHKGLRAETRIPGLYLTGADIVSCGVAGAASAGLITASLLMTSDVRGLFRRRSAQTTPGFVTRKPKRDGSQRDIS